MQSQCQLCKVIELAKVKNGFWNYVTSNTVGAPSEGTFWKTVMCSSKSTSCRKTATSNCYDFKLRVKKYNFAGHSSTGHHQAAYHKFAWFSLLRPHEYFLVQIYF